MRKRRYTDAQILELSRDPNIKEITPFRLRFTLSFRKQIYDAVKEEISHASIKKYLTEQGYDCHTLGIRVIDTLSTTYKKHGRPVNGSYYVNSRMYHHGMEDDTLLLQTGKFVKSRNGLAFSDAFSNELYHAYPAQTIEEGIRKAGIDPALVGYQRIQTLKRRFEGKNPVHRRNIYSDEIVERYKNHPYVKKVTHKQFVLNTCFYNEAVSLSSLSVDDLLNLYEFISSDFSAEFRNNLKFRIAHWKKTDQKVNTVSLQVVQIQLKRMQALQEILTQQLTDDGILYHIGNWQDKKEICCKLALMPEDPERVYTVSWYLRYTGIPRSSFYEILRNDDYGNFYQKKNQQDEEDAEVIRSVIAYKGFDKGARQIYMDMQDITGVQFGMKKIYRLMHKYGIETSIRRKRNYRQAVKLLMKRNTKPNLLKRRFRLFEPNEVRLTDVTYLDYGNGKRAYGSASKDPVTGRLIDYTISESNDLNLVMTTLDHISKQPLLPGAILHSDQGALYLTDTFQNKVKETGMKESMSKRGNCWDNAPQESFFGHFKDEANYRECTTLDELRQICSEYMYYYNNERHQWNLNRMTPVQYEKYLLDMTNEEKDEYFRREEIKYQKMKERATEEAKARADSLGV